MPKTYFPDLPKLPDPAEPIEQLIKGVEAITGRFLGFEKARRELFRKVNDSVRDVQQSVRQRRP